MNHQLSTIRIRLAAASEVAAVTACVQDAYVHYVARIGRQPGPMTADYAALIARQVVWVVPEPDQAIAGVLVMLAQPGALFIENVAVHPRRQGLGLGGRLLAFAEQHARAIGVAEMRLYTNAKMTENIALYEHLGFEQTDRRVESGFQRVFMRKRL